MRIDPRLKDWRLVLLAAVAVVAIVAVEAHGPIPQPQGYHSFADSRTWLGIPNFADTVSNLPFFLVGIAGVVAVSRAVPKGALPALRPAYLFFFLGTALLLPGSGYYHLHPSDASLVWDRLPMAVAFMAFFAVVLGEHVGPAIGRVTLLPLVALGALSVAWWRITDTGNGGDLRFYVLVQYLPMLLIPLIAWLYPSPFRPPGYLWALLLSYGLAKALEFLDAPLFRALGVLSGHSLKHLAAAFGILVFLVGLYRRRTEEGA